MTWWYLVWLYKPWSSQIMHLKIKKKTDNLKKAVPNVAVYTSNRFWLRNQQSYECETETIDDIDEKVENSLTELEYYLGHTTS